MAASTCRWSTFFKTDTRDWIAVGIFDVNYNNDPESFTLGKTPVSIKWDGKGEDRFSPMIASSCVVEFVIENDTQRQYWTDAFNDYQEQTVFVKIIQIANDPDYQPLVVWSGWMLGDLASEEQDEYPWLLKLKFTDSMALLKNHPFCDDDTTAPITNYEDNYASFMFWIVDSLKKINVGGFGSAFTDVTPLANQKPLKTFVHWYNNTVSPTSIAYDPLHAFGCRPRPLWDVADNGAIKPKSCYEAIEMFCKVWGARFVFFNNKYHFIQLNYYFHSEFDVISNPQIGEGYLYDWDFAASQEDFVFDTNLEYETRIRPSAFKTVNTLMGGKQTFYPPLKRVISTYGRWMGINLLTTCPAANSTSNVDGWRGNIDMEHSYELGTFKENSELVFRNKWLTELTNGGVGYNCFQNLFQTNYPPGAADYGYAGTNFPNPLLMPGSAHPEIRFTLQLTHLDTSDIYAIRGGVDANGGVGWGGTGAFTLGSWTTYLANPYPTMRIMGNYVATNQTYLYNWGSTLCDHNFRVKFKTGTPNGIASLPASASGYSIIIHFFDVLSPFNASYNTTNFSSSSSFAVDSTFGCMVTTGNDFVSEKKDNFDNGDPAGAGTGMYVDVKGLNTGTLGADITYDPALLGSNLYPSGLECGIFHIDSDGQYTGAPFTWVIDNNGTGASVVASTLEYKTGALLFGDGRQTHSFGAIKWDNAGSWDDPAATGWARDLPSGGNYITELLGKEILLGQANLTSKFDLTVTRSTRVLNYVDRVSPLTRLRYRGMYLLPLRCAWNLQTDEWKGKWFEVKESSGNQDNNPDALEAGSASIDGVKAGGSLQKRSINAGGGMADIILTYTSALISAGATTELPINPITLGALGGAVVNTTTETAVLKAGDRITLLADLSATPAERDGSGAVRQNYSLLITADQKAGDTTLTVESFTPDWDIASESGITFQKSQYLQKVLGVRNININELSDLPDCWYDPSDADTLTVTAANIVTAITNKAQDSNTLTYAGTGAQYDLATLKLPSVRLNGVDDYYTLGTDLENIEEFDFFMVIHPDPDQATANPYQTYMGYNNGQNWIRQNNSQNNYNFKLGNTANSTGNLPVAVVAGQSQVIRFSRRATDLENYTDTVEINGIGDSDDVVGTAPTDGAFNRIGARNTLAETTFFDGNFGEILLYTTAITDSNAIQILNYLKNKWL